MDCKLQVFSDNLTATVDKMDLICSLAAGLDISHEITDLLFSAKRYLTDCKLLTHVKLLQVTEKHHKKSIDTFHDFVDTVGLKDDLNGEDESALSANSLKSETENVKTESDSVYRIDDIDVVETKIEVEENENACDENFELQVVKKKRKRTKNIVPKTKRSKPINEQLVTSDNPAEQTDSSPKTKVPKISCKHCYKSIPEQQHKDHESICSPLQIQCTTCGRMCNGRKNYTNHMRTHNLPAIYSCDVCDKKFRTGGELTRHKTRKHIDLKTCEICGQIGIEKYALKDHMKIHENRERPFSCDACGMSFYVAANLKAHMIVHSDEKPFSCDVCNKSFKYKNSLVSHILLHNKELSRIKCDHCGKSLGSKKALRNHERKVHKIIRTVRAKRSTNSLMHVPLVSN